MCRWVSYLGPPIPMDVLLVHPENSLLVQSLQSKEGKEPTNGDGFGIGWYNGRDPVPGLYREIRPAWNDENVRDLAAHIVSPLFLGHVRAATGTAVQRSNCHPFRHGRWLFQHNGLIPGFHKIRRELMMDLDEDLFDCVRGTSDSELVFFLALTLGLRDDPLGALERTVGHIERVMRHAGVPMRLQFSVALADGETLYAVRYSSESASRTLYYTRDPEAARRLYPDAEIGNDTYTLVVSEPLGSVVEWREVPESTSITARGPEVEMQSFTPK